MDNSTPNIAEQLVLYLDGLLAGAEKRKLEELLVTDQGVQAQYESLQQTRAAIQYYGLTQKVAGIHKSMINELQPAIHKTGSGRKLLRYTMAAAASLLLIIGAFMAYSFFNLSPDKLFSANYNTYELTTVRDAGDPGMTAVEKAYNEKNYKEVLRIHDAGEDHTPKGEFLCGVAALELRDDAKAIKCFKEVLDANKQSGQRVLNDESEYYLSLSYVRNKDYDFALPLLRKIKDDSEHKYNSQVTSRMIRKVKLLKWR